MIKKTVVENTIQVTTDYNKEFITFAKQQNAKWNPGKRTWDFDADREQQIDEALFAIFAWRETAGEMVKVIFDAYDLEDFKTGIVQFGKMPLVVRGRRDWDVDISQNVRVLSGAFKEYGGSMKHPSVSVNKGEVKLEITIDKEYFDKYIGDYDKIDYTIL